MTKALRYNKGKLKWSLVDYSCLEDLVRVMEFGATKYGRNNWTKGLKQEEVIESLLRHTYAILRGEMIDPESGISHVGHIQANAMFLGHKKLGHKKL
jgi:hypothetical protein